MKKILFFLCLYASIGATANDSIAIVELQEKVIVIQRKYSVLQRENQRLQRSQQEFKLKLDSLQNVLVENNRKSQQSIQTLDGEIKSVQNTTEKKQIELSDSMQMRTIVGFVSVAIVLLVLGIVYYLLHKRINKGTSTIDKIQDSQKMLQEESIKLDDKLIELLNTQFNIQKTANKSNDIDHSLALKVADEIIRIENNLRQMDSSIRGYKQLLKAVERIKEDFTNKEYEIVELLGKPFIEGMKAFVTYVVDENLKENEQYITKVKKPQVNYKGVMIQAATIEVSQNE